MDDTLMKYVIIAIVVVITAAFVGTVAWTMTIGTSIASRIQDTTITLYSEAGLSMMVDANNIDDIDATNLYKVMEVNRNIITDWTIRNIDGSMEKDNRELLNRPTDRFSINIEGDSAIGFKLEAQQVYTKKVGE